MTEHRLVDDIRDEVMEIARQLDIAGPLADQLATELVRHISDRWGGERHYVHRIGREERTVELALDPRPIKEAAKAHGVDRTTVWRARQRRVISNGLKGR